MSAETFSQLITDIQAPDYQFKVDTSDPSKSDSPQDAKLMQSMHHFHKVKFDKVIQLLQMAGISPDAATPQSFTDSTKFPTTGKTGILYFDETNGTVYYWNGTKYLSMDSLLLNGKDSSYYLNTATNQTVGGTKTFTSSPAIPDATASNEPLSKGQLLAAIKAIDGAGSGLDADTVDGVQGALLGVGGSGYSWVDETSNRALNTTYTNTTGKPIFISIILNAGNTATSPVFDIDGMQVGRYNINVDQQTVSEIVPNGSSYVINNTNADTSIRGWLELK